jgi:hypothetical protein
MTSDCRPTPRHRRAPSIVALLMRASSPAYGRRPRWPRPDRRTVRVEVAQAVASHAAAHLVLDVTGYYVAGSGASYVPLEPVRLLDTRVGNGLAGPFVASTPRTVRIAGQGGIPAEATAVTVNLTVVGQTAGGYVSLTPTPTATPTTSSLNFPPGDIRANGATVPLAPDGTLSLVYRPNPSPPGPGLPSFDSRYHSPRELLATIQTLERSTGPDPHLLDRQELPGT